LGTIDIFKIAVFGEAYDILVDISSEKPDFTLINLGVLPVGYPVIENLVVTNRGNYDIYFRYKLVKLLKSSAKMKPIYCFIKF
jgi:hypothetical protein